MFFFWGPVLPRHQGGAACAHAPPPRPWGQNPLELSRNTPIGRIVDFRAGGHPNNQGLSRKHVMAACEASLKRLGTDYIDLYQIHRWDYETPVEETMLALHDLVRSGKVRYIGASR